MTSGKKAGAALVAINLAAWVVAILIVLPIVWMVVTSFKPELDAARFPPSFVSFAWTFDNYRQVLDDGTYFTDALNSLLIASGSTALAFLFGIPAAWAMAFAPSKRTHNLLLWMLSTKMLPPVGVLVPIYLLGRQTGLLDTRTLVIAILCAGNMPIVVWMLFANFREVPKEILEAARMDGAAIVHELGRILLPLALPGLASTFLLVFTLAWNEAFWTLSLTSANAAPLTALIATFSSPQGLFLARLSAASVLAILPVLIIGWFSQRQLVQGLTFGAVK